MDKGNLDDTLLSRELLVIKAPKFAALVDVKAVPFELLVGHAIGAIQSQPEITATTPLFYDYTWEWTSKNYGLGHHLPNSLGDTFLSFVPAALLSQAEEIMSSMERRKSSWM